MLKIKAQVNIMLGLYLLFQYFQPELAFKISTYNYKKENSVSQILFKLQHLAHKILHRLSKQLLRMASPKPYHHMFVVFAFCICRFSLSSSLRRFRNIAGSGGKTNVTDHRTAGTIQLFVAISESFSSLLFFGTTRSEGKIFRDGLIKVATCLFA